MIRTMAYSRCVSLDCMKLIVPKGDYCSVSAGYVTFGIPLTANECQTDHRVSKAMETQCSSYGINTHDLNFRYCMSKCINYSCLSGQVSMNIFFCLFNNFQYCFKIIIFIYCLFHQHEKSKYEAGPLF